jgi:excisionase family DNA binding protein
MHKIANPSLLTPAEVARRLRQDRATIYRKIRAGVLPAVRLNDGRGALRMPADELAAWLYADPKETDK